VTRARTRRSRPRRASGADVTHDKRVCQARKFEGKGNTSAHVLYLPLRIRDGLISWERWARSGLTGSVRGAGPPGGHRRPAEPSTPVPSVPSRDVAALAVPSRAVPSSAVRRRRPPARSAGGWARHGYSGPPAYGANFVPFRSEPSDSRGPAHDRTAVPQGTYRPDRFIRGGTTADGTRDQGPRPPRQVEPWPRRSSPRGSNATEVAG